MVWAPRLGGQGGALALEPVKLAVVNFSSSQWGVWGERTVVVCIGVLGQSAALLQLDVALETM